MKIYGDENNEFILKELGRRIKDMRLRRSMTQKELADNASVAHSTIVRIENGEGVNIDNLLKVMRILNLLQNIDILIPEQELTPEEIYNHVPKRKRASKLKQTIKNSNWTWGDEK